MGVSTDGILAYGYNLGDDPTFADLDRDVEDPAWWDLDRQDFGTAATNHLLAAAGLGRRDFEQLGVEIVTHCSDRAPMWILAAKSVEAYRGTPKTITIADLTDGVPTWRERLVWAVEVLGLKVDGEPRWLLASFWGE